MAVLNDIRRLPGADAILAAHGTALPQPDQLCGPFSAVMALHALLDEPPMLPDLAVAAGTRIWPHDVSEWRPPGAPLDRTAWDQLPTTDDLDLSGTDASGLAAGIAATCEGITTVPAAGPDWAGLGPLLAALARLDHAVGVVANVRTGPIAPPGLTWDVGHFVVIWAVDGDVAAVADTYVELGAPDQPPGCRLVGLGDLALALPGRGLLLLVGDDGADGVRRLVHDAGLNTDLWET